MKTIKEQLEAAFNAVNEAAARSQPVVLAALTNHVAHLLDKVGALEQAQREAPEVEPEEVK